MRAPLVSVGLPTYNRAAALKRAIDSVLAQDYSNLELVISDNASTDDTNSVCAGFLQRDPRVKYFRHPANLGANANYREVLKQASGEFFMWLGDDDWIEPSYVSKCAQVLAAHPDHSLVSGTARYFVGEKFAYEREKINLLQDSGADRVLSYYRQVIANGLFYGLMRREQLMQLPLQEILAGDWLLIAAVALTGKIQTLDDVFVNRQLKGLSESLELLARHLGHSDFQSRHYFFTMATIIFKDIAWKSPAYKSLGKVGRLRLAAGAFAVVSARLCWPQWGVRTRLRQVTDLIKG